MAFSAKVYRIMIASPSDVKKERDAVEDVLSEWNHKYGEEKGILFIPLRWEKDSAPLMGQAPQDILNRQLCERSDFLIAMFWSRMGTPTEGFASGTLEEIQQHMDAGKPVMFYFCEKPLPGTVDVEQLQLLREYKKEIERNRSGLYHTFKSRSDLKSKLMDHLRTMVDTNEFFRQDAPCTNIAERKPQLCVLINGQKSITLKAPETPLFDNHFYKDEDMEYAISGTDIPDMTFQLFEADARCILENRIPPELKPWLNPKLMKKFCDLFPDQKALEEYMFRWKQFYARNQAVEVSFTLENNGTAVADEIYVNIQEPENAWIMSKSDFRKLKNFSPAPDPIHTARQKRAADKLLHGRNTVFKTAYLLPKREGKAEWTYTCQCSQLIAPVTGKLEVEVAGT